MQSSSAVNIVLAGYVAQLPVLLVCLAGIFVVAVRRQEAPAACAWATAGLALSIVAILLGPAVQQVLFRSFMGHNPAHFSAIIMAFNFAWSTVRAVSYVLLLAAIFAGRKPAQAPSASAPVPQVH